MSSVSLVPHVLRRIAGLPARGWALVTSVAMLVTIPRGLYAQACDSARVASLPVIERPATGDTGTVLVVLMTGDGGWANADEQVSRGLLERGAAVAGLDMRAYLKRRKTPDELARDVSCLADSHLARWRRSYLMLLGYSRGADLAPFAASRLPPGLRQRLTMVAMVSPSTAANFQFHWIDLVRDVRRDDDVPVAPEVSKLRDIRVVCIYGRDDADSACTRLDSAVVRVVSRPGGHRIKGGFEVMADVLAEGLHPRSPPVP